MNHCHNCGLSIGETVTFCATCGAPVSVAVAGTALESATPPSAQEFVTPSSVLESVTPPSAPVEADAQSTAAAPAMAACRLCGGQLPTIDAAGVCPACRAQVALFVAAESEEPRTVSLATGVPAAGRERVTVVNAIYSALADDGTCPACRAMDGRETTDAAAAVVWTPNPQCDNPAGCRCLVFFEHESLSVDEEREFVDYAAGRGLRVTAAAVAAFHEEKRRARTQVEQRLDEASRLLCEARTLEKSDPRDAVALYRKAVESLLAAGESPLDEYRVRRDLPLALNRLTLLLERMGRAAEALDEIDRAASRGILERDDCGRKSDREALRKRSRRLHERRGAVVTG
ncbi:MAG: hypothetical protein ABR941_02025 [Thermoleophilia bacterium]